jgi:hypothetical protein
VLAVSAENRAREFMTIDSRPSEILAVCAEQIGIALALFRAAVLDETAEEPILPLSDRGIRIAFARNRRAATWNWRYQDSFCIKRPYSSCSAKSRLLSPIVERTRSEPTSTMERTRHVSQPIHSNSRCDSVVSGLQR